MDILKIRDLSVTFPSLGANTRAVNGVDLTLRQGEVLALVGESGSGKSVTSLGCLGLVPTPGIVTGSVKLDEYEIVGAEDHQLQDIRGSGIAMIFQNPMAALNPFFTIASQLIAPIRKHRNFDYETAKNEALISLGKVQMPDPQLALEKYPHQLSGGQLQRVMIALALACKPRVLIADEPTTALDVTVQAQILLLLRQLLKDEKLSILFITHDLGVVATLADRVAVMYAGRIVEIGDIKPIFAEPKHPYTKQLLATVPRLGRSKDNLHAIEGQVPDMAAPPSGCAFHPRCNQCSEICRTDIPVLQSFDENNKVACHHPVHISSGGSNGATVLTNEAG